MNLYYCQPLLAKGSLDNMSASKISGPFLYSILHSYADNSMFQHIILDADITEILWSGLNITFNGWWSDTNVKLTF